MKHKTHKGASKRIKFNKKGSMTKGHINHSHLHRKDDVNASRRKSKFNSPVKKGYKKKIKNLINKLKT